MSTLVPFPFNDGINRSKTAQKCEGGFYQLQELQHDPDNFGVIKQVPYYRQSLQFSQGTYWTGSASATEPSSSCVVAQINDLITVGGTMILTDYVARQSNGTQIQCFYQIPPVGTTINDHCFIVINNVAGLALTLGNSLSIRIVTPTTFEWSKNGGGWTAGGTCSTTGTSIDSGNVTVYFLIASGFTASVAWSWERTDRSGGAGTASRGVPIQFEYFRTSVFYLANTSRLMQICTNINAEIYIVSAGYQPVYGLGLAIFYDHLIITSFATNVSLVLTSKVIANSDSLDINVFFSTDVNEADTFTPPDSAAITLTGPVVYRNTLFIFTSGTVYYTNYLGLPIVFNYQPFISFPAGTGQASLYTGDTFAAKGSSKGVYIISRNLVYLFDGVSFNEITQKLYGISLAIRSVHYVGNTFELWIRDGNNYAFVYQEQFGTWYQRRLSFGSPVDAAFGCIDANANLGVNTRRILTYDSFATNTPVESHGSGTLFPQPLLVTQALNGGNFSQVKACNGTFLSPRSITAGANYASLTTCSTKLRWFIEPTGDLTGTPLTHASATWTSSQTSTMYAFPRESFRCIALWLEINATNGKPPAGISFVALELQVEKWPTTQPLR